MMDSLEEKIGSVLSNPQLMEQIMNMANSFSQTSPAQDSPKQSPKLPDIDPGLIRQLSNLAGQGSVDKNQQTLLSALSPYLSNDRISRLERAMRAAKMAKLASSFLNQEGLSFLTGR